MASIQDILLQQQQNSNTNYQPLIEANPAAANMLAQGATTAGNIGQSYLQQGIGSIQQGGAASTATRQPFIQGAQGALGQALDLTGISGKSADQVLQQMQQSPAYQFNLQEQLDALDRGAASRGKLYSGQQMKAYQDRAAQVASNEYQNQINNALSLLGQTSPFAQSQAGQQYQLGTDVATMQSQIGDALGNAELARTNALAEGLLGEASARVAQSSASGAPLPELDQEVYAGGSTSPWGNTVGQQEPDLTEGLGSDQLAQGGAVSAPSGGSTDSGSTTGGTGATGGTGEGTFTDANGNTYTYDAQSDTWTQVPATGGSNPEYTPPTGAPATATSGDSYTDPQGNTYTYNGTSWTPSLDSPVLDSGLGGQTQTPADQLFADQGLGGLSTISAYNPDFGESLLNETPEVQQNLNTILGYYNNELSGATPEQTNEFYRILGMLFEAAPTYREDYHIANNINSALRQSGIQQ